MDSLDWIRINKKLFFNLICNMTKQILLYNQSHYHQCHRCQNVYGLRTQWLPCRENLSFFNFYLIYSRNLCFDRWNSKRCFPYYLSLPQYVSLLYLQFCQFHSCGTQFCLEEYFLQYQMYCRSDQFDLFSHIFTNFENTLVFRLIVSSVFCLQCRYQFLLVINTYVIFL